MSHDLTTSPKKQEKMIAAPDNTNSRCLSGTRLEDQYNVVRRIDWIRKKLLSGLPFNSTDLTAEFDISVRTAHRDIRFVREEYFGDQLKYDIVNRSYCLSPD